MIDINKIKSRLNSLSNTNQKSNILWKPSPGKQEVRIVPYKFQPDNPFVELKFHYNLNGKTYLSPDTFGRPDPIVEFANRLKKTGDKEDWKMSKKMEPKLRTFAPVLVRGFEHEGVKFWGFGKQVYQELMSVVTDPDYGDITDLAKGRDIVVEFKTAEEAGKQYPETTVRVKPNTKPAVDPTDKGLLEKISSQTNILDLFPELSYDELKDVMNAWLHPENEESPLVSASDPVIDQAASTSNEVINNVEPGTVSAKPSVKLSDAEVEAKFEELFSQKNK